jgi:4-amino-4-deoxy-L-arabinose transferase-like glycosyltransferase
MKKKILLLSNIQIALILFVLSGMIVLIFWFLLPGGFQETEATDFQAFYKPIAVNILAGNGFAMGDRWMMRYPPGFPIIIAGFLGLARIVNAQPVFFLALMILLFSMGSSVLMYFLGELVWGKAGGVISSLLWMTYPFQLWLAKQPNSEPPFIFFFLLGVTLVLIAVKKKRASLLVLLLAGFSFGIAMLIRPIAIGLGVVLAFVYLLIARRSKLQLAAGIFLILIGNVAAIFPWEYATFVHTAKIVPLSSLGPDSLRLGFTFPVKLDGFRTAVNVPEDVRVLTQQILDDSLEVSSSGEQFLILWDHFQEEPVSFLKLMLIKLGRVWYGSDTNKYDRFSLIIQVFYLLLFILSAYLAGRKTAQGGFLLRAILPCLFYFWGMTILGMPLLRYMVPVISLLFLLTPAWIQSLPAARMLGRFRHDR